MDSAKGNRRPTKSGGRALLPFLMEGWGVLPLPLLLVREKEGRGGRFYTFRSDEQAGHAERTHVEAVQFAVIDV